MILLGFDPGGLKRFGWATLHIDNAGAVARLMAGVCSNASDAVGTARQSAGSAPDGVGIDAPLFWVPKGDRRVDAHIRKRVVAAGGQSGTVSSVNSLKGACLVQGILAARLAAISWPAAVITEAHPKALLRVCPDAQRFVTMHASGGIEEHARDAALSAFAAWAAVTARDSWRNLIFDEVEPYFPGGAPVAYWFPR